MSANNNLNEKLKNFSKNELVEEIKRECTLQEIKELLVGFVTVARTFTDGKNADMINKYKSRITAADKVKLLMYLTSQPSTRKESKLDVTTFKKPEHTGIKIGRESFTMTLCLGELTDEVKCNRGLIGPANAAMHLSTIGSVCNKISTTEKGYKNVVYDAANKFAPKEAMTNLLAESGMLPMPTAASIETVGKQIFYSDMKLIAPVVEMVNALIPTIETENKVLAPVVTFKTEGNKLTFRGRKIASYVNTVEGDYPEVAAGIEIYRKGTKNPGIKRIAKNVYLGVPVEGLPYEHVTSLMEAGVKKGDSVLVVSADGNMLTALRSTFGVKVKGIGNGVQMVTETKAKVSMYDWVYYPTPVTVNKGQSFATSMSESIQKIRKVHSIYSMGKLIMHISPLFFYCKEFCEAMGYEVQGAPKKTKISAKKQEVVDEGQDYGFDDNYEDDLWHAERIPKNWYDLLNPIVTHVEGEDEDRVFTYKPLREGGPTDWVSDLYNTPDWKQMTFREQLEHYKELWEGSLVSDEEWSSQLKARIRPLVWKLRNVDTTFTEVTYNQISSIEVPLQTTVLSYKGVMMYVEGKKGVLMKEACGRLLYHMREVFRQIWVPTCMSPHTYKIKFFRKGAMVDQLEFDDMYSPMYSTEVFETFEEEEKKVVSKIEQGLDPPKGKEKEEKEESDSGEDEGGDGDFFADT